MSHRKYCFKIFENIYSSGIFSLFLWKRVWQLGGWGWKVNTDTLRPNKYWSQKLLKVLNAWTDHIPSEVKDNFVSICHWRLRDSILHLSPSLPVQAEGRKQGVTNYCQWVKTKVSLHRYLFSIQVNSPVCEAMMQPGMYDKSVTHTKNCWHLFISLPYSPAWIHSYRRLNRMTQCFCRPLPLFIANFTLGYLISIGRIPACP